MKEGRSMKLETVNKNREIETDYLKIHGNCMEFKNTVIQLNNISLLSTEDLSPISFPTVALIAAAAGLVLLLTEISALLWLALACFVGSGASIYIWYKENKRLGEMKRLLIITNSGNHFNIVFQDKPFLERVVKVLKEVVANPGHLSDITINVKENTFSGGSSVIKDFQEVHY